MTAVSPVLEATIDVDAPIGRVWAVVADLSSMGRRSPQCRVSKPLGPIRPGTFVVHLNNDGWKWWPTTARITTVEPQREIAFRVLENGSEWAYVLEPIDGGLRTRVIEQRRAPRGTTKLSQFLIAKALGGNENFEAALVRGMQETLTKVKHEAETDR